MSPSPNVPARLIRYGAISSSAGSAPRRSAAPESTLHETIRGALRSAQRQAWPFRRSLRSHKKKRSCKRGGHDAHAQNGIHHRGGDARYLGLAILGWGSFAAFFSHPALIALVIVGF